MSVSQESLVRGFLLALARSDIDGALACLDENVAYTSASLPTVHGRDRVGRLLRVLSSVSFGAQLINVVDVGDVVLTERVDKVRLGPFVARLWICGRFEVVGTGAASPRITVWRDYFDWRVMIRLTARGMAGMAVPQLRPRPTLAVSVDRSL